MITVEVFDPPMCCSTGVCGPNVDPALARFSADLHWLSNQGIHVERYNLSQQPQHFVANALVKATLTQEGDKCLPLILVNGRIASQGGYPLREELAKLSGLRVQEAPASLYTEAVAELVAIGAAIAANCQPCFKHHFQQAKKLGVSREDMMLAVQTAQGVKETPAKAVLDLAHRILEGDPAALPIVRGCCG